MNIFKKHTQFKYNNIKNTHIRLIKFKGKKHTQKNEKMSAKKK